MACIPPAGFARTPTPALPTLAPAALCEDYVRDADRAVKDLLRDLAPQIADLTVIAASARPDPAVGRRVTDRRDDLATAISHFEGPAPCLQGESSRVRIERAAVHIRLATSLVNIAADLDSAKAYGEAIAPYRQALESLQ